MKRYYIKAWFGDWVEVLEEKANEFIISLRKGATCINEKTEKDFINRHLKIVDE